jgi:DNA-binding SARP family transcriptional activator/tetratricopeptide (TPR) repeat protein
VRFRVLGPVEARADAGSLVPLPAKPRSLLAVLLLETGRRVSRDRLMAALWSERPPRSAPGVMRSYLSALRQPLSLSPRGPLPRLEAVGDGYRLEVGPSDLDMLVFGDLAERGRQALLHGDAAAAIQLLDQALGLWRGDPAEDVTVDDETAVVMAGLAERRLLAEEDRVEAGLALGNDATLIPRLRLLVAGHPLRERLWGQLMTALYLAGQQAAALAAYRQLRVHLAAELGVEPDSRLQKLNEKILAGEPLPGAQTALLLHLARPVPRQLPPDASHFTGRAAELERLDGLVDGSGAAPLPPVMTIVISGTAGVGKTALANRWAHQVADRFPDGQLYASLHGHDATAPADPLEVLARFMRALGVAAEQVPEDLEEAAGMYRSLLDGKRILVLLDNAASTGQVRALLPGTPGCVVIVTSRNRLTGLRVREGPSAITLLPFVPAEAVELLHKILGPGRAAAEPAALAAIADECAYLPLALRIAAERASARPHHTLGALAAQLAVASGQLDMLDADDDPATSVRAVFSWSYQSLAPDTARMFRLAGLHPGPDISVPAAAALADCDTHMAARLLETLANAHLVEIPAADRYRFHDLLRAYATECAAADEDEAERTAALRRVLTWYLHTADAAAKLLAPARRQVPLEPSPANCRPLSFADYEHAIAWCDVEHLNLVAAIHAAASCGEHQIAWNLPVALADYVRTRKLWAEGIKYGQASLPAPRRANDAHAEAWVLNGLAAAHHALGQFHDSLDFLQRSLKIRRHIGDRYDETSTLNNIGAVYGDLGQLDAAAGQFQCALDLATRTGDKYGQCSALYNLAEAHLKLRQPGKALEYGQQALAIASEIGCRQIEGVALTTLGDVSLTCAQAAAAEAHYQQALIVWQRASDRHREAATHRRLGDLHHRNGNTPHAHEHWLQALAIFEGLGDPQASELRSRLREEFLLQTESQGPDLGARGCIRRSSVRRWRSCAASGGCKVDPACGYACRRARSRPGHRPGCRPGGRP